MRVGQAAATTATAHSTGPRLRRSRPLLRRLRVESPLREVYLALHSFRGEVPLLAAMFGLGHEGSATQRPGRSL